jgi:hypothetical protein
MSVRSTALRWFEAQFGQAEGAIHASKFYEPEESWTKRRAWAHEIPLEAIKSGAPYVHLLCQVAPTSSEFYYLQVPSAYLLEHLPKLAVRDSNRVSLFLSAEPPSSFVDERGPGRVSFARFRK